MITPPEVWFPFNFHSRQCANLIRRLLTLLPGHLGLYIYIDESEDIQARLIQHLDGDNPCISGMDLLGFQFEFSEPSARVLRQAELIDALNPSRREMLS